MKFTAEVSALRRAADAACAGVLAKGSIPILGCIRIDAEEGLRLTGTDCDVEVTTTCAASVAKRGSACVDATSLRAFVGSLAASGHVEGEIEKDRLSLRSGRARAQFGVFKAADFPRFGGTAVFTQSIALSTKELERLLDRTAWSMSADATRPCLQGIYLHHKDGQLIAVSTNGAVLSRTGMDLPSPASMSGIILPRPTVTALAKLIKGAEGDCALSLSDTLARFEVGPTRITTKLIDGTYPDYERVIPERQPAPLGFARKAALEALARAMTAAEARRDGRAVALDLEEGLITLTASGEHGQVKDEIEATGKARFNRCGFNGAYLRAALDVLDGEDVEFHLGDPQAPASFRGSEDRPLDLVVVMPMRV